MHDLNDKIFSVWKPSGITSNAIIYGLRERYSLKAGHAGTLDPFAEGVVVVCTGKKTKEIQNLQLFHKKYTAKIRLGIITDTLDSDGTIVFKQKVPEIKKKDIENVLKTFVGKIMQRPPAFSALRKNNVRLYSLARKDVFLNLKPREVHVESILLKEIKDSYLTIEIVCKSGTYIRSLARDIAKSIGTCGYLDQLTREYVGVYAKDNSYLYEEILSEDI